MPGAALGNNVSTGVLSEHATLGYLLV